jgi:hypothetical protein
LSIKFRCVSPVLPIKFFHRLDLPWESAFLAGKCFVKYRQQGGTKKSPLPDFYIGAHPVIMDMILLTRDVNRYRTYFPSLELIVPEF